MKFSKTSGLGSPSAALDVHVVLAAAQDTNALVALVRVVLVPVAPELDKSSPAVLEP